MVYHILVHHQPQIGDRLTQATQRFGIKFTSPPTDVEISGESALDFEVDGTYDATKMAARFLETGETDRGDAN